LKVDAKGLKFQNWLYLMLFSVVILVVLWALQFILLDRFYESMKLGEIRDIGDRITAQFGNADHAQVMQEYAFRNNIRVMILNGAGVPLVNYDGFPTDAPIMPLTATMIIGFPLDDFGDALRRLEASRASSISYIDEDQMLDMSRSVYISYLSTANDESYYLYITSPIPSIDSTVSVLKRQFFIITTILFILSLIAAQWISRKLTKPIITLTESSQRLVKGELDATFYDNGYTEIHQLASALNYATDELRSLDTYRREFIANISHDLKTPLTIIRFYGELIKDVSGDDPKKRDEHCDTIIKEADWLTDMVGEILELSRLESPNRDITRTEVDMSQCLADTLASFHVLEEREGYAFEVSAQEDMVVSGNAAMLRRVMYNLISNAVNFTGDDKRVKVTLTHNGDSVRFAVTDTGAGITPEEQNVIWDRYYKSDEVHKRAVVGTGIGLSIAKSILVHHEASYGVVSAPGVGSTFWFELPRV